MGELDSEQGVCCIVVQGNRLFAGMSSGAIVIWDLETSTVIGQLKEHEGSILVMHFLNGLLYSGDSEGKVRYLDIILSESVATYNNIL